MQLLKVLDLWTEYLESGGQIDVIYTDLEKAFDKVPHRRLISKLHSYYIHTDVVEWITCFLTNRRQRVQINDSFSLWATVFSGIPQGSVLGPLLFVIYINDLVENCSAGSDIYLYADDAKLFKHILHEIDCTTLQADLYNMSSWMDHGQVAFEIKRG